MMGQEVMSPDNIWYINLLDDAQKLNGVPQHHALEFMKGEPFRVINIIIHYIFNCYKIILFIHSWAHYIVQALRGGLPVYYQIWLGLEVEANRVVDFALHDINVLRGQCNYDSK